MIDEEPLNFALEIVTPDPKSQFWTNWAGVSPRVEQSVTDSCAKLQREIRRKKSKNEKGKTFFKTSKIELNKYINKIVQ
jgi:hypothetical protein